MQALRLHPRADGLAVVCSDNSKRHASKAGEHGLSCLRALRELAYRHPRHHRSLRCGFAGCAR